MDSYLLTATEALARFRDGALTVEQYARSLLARIGERDPAVKAWVHIDPDYVIEQARRLDQIPAEERGPLHGVAVAVKDVIYTKGMPTQHNSPIYEGDGPELDAGPIAILRAAGALLLGKTTTTEFASTNVGPTTCNPHDLARTPGGSSSGSAAAVSDLQAPVALGTQTGGSIIRPASFNGIFGLKPTWNSITREGVKFSAPIYDTLGFFARSVEDLDLLAEVFGLADDHLVAADFRVQGSKFALVRTPVWSEAGPGTIAALERATKLLREHGAEVDEIELPPEFNRMREWYWTVLYSEGQTTFLPEYKTDKERLHQALIDQVENRTQISHRAHLEAFDGIASLRPVIDKIAKQYAAIVAPSVPDVAPLGQGSTGSQVFNNMWTALHTPVVNIPGFRGEANMPIGLSLVAPRYYDRHLLKVAKAVGSVFTAEGSDNQRGGPATPVGGARLHSRSETLVPDVIQPPDTPKHGDSGPAAGLDTSVPPPEEWIPQFVGLSGDQDPYVLRHFQFRNNRYKRQGWACIRVVGEGHADPVHFSVVPDSHLDAWAAWYPTPPQIDVDSMEHKKILETYFSVVHASYPVLEPALLRKPQSRLYQPLIGAVYQLAQSLTPDIAQTAAQKAYQWRKFMYQALPIEARYPRLETIEAGLCFIQRRALIHRAPTTPGLWSEIGSLVGIAHELGINVDPSNWEIEDSQKSRRIRIAWALFTTEEWAALGLGRPCYISKDDWSVPMVTEDDFPDPETPACAKAVFIAMTKLSLILADVLHTFYTSKAQRDIRMMSADSLLELMAGFESQLDLFFDTALQPLESLAFGKSMLDPSGTVELAYYTLRIIIYRAVLRYLPPGESHTIRQRAQTALLDVVQLLSGQVTRLRAFWWSPPSSINFAIVGSFMLSMLLSSVDEAEVDFWMTIVDRYQLLLDLHSATFDITKLATRRLELLELLQMCHLMKQYSATVTSGRCVFSKTLLFCLKPHLVSEKTRRST